MAWHQENANLLETIKLGENESETNDKPHTSYYAFCYLTPKVLE